MERRHYIAAWVLLGLVAAGVVVPPIVIFVLQPKRVTVEEVKIDGVLPLDVFILIDSSFSIGRPDWELALDFGRKVSLQLQERLPRVRAGMGQFATNYQVIRSLSENLSDWGDLSDIQKLKGQTGMAHGLCGDSVGNPFSGCTGGAYAQLVNAPPPKPNSSLDCGENVTALRAVLIVTDGVTADPDVMVEAARFVKNENVTIMGVLVKSTEDKELDAAELYTLSSCCPSSSMELAMLRPDWQRQKIRPNCTAEKDSACPFLAMSADFEALGKTVDKIASQVDQVLVCERKEITKVFESDWGTLWFLLLLAPAVLFLCWQNVLLCLSKSEHFAMEVRASLAARRHELEMSTATEGLAAVSDAADLAAEAGKAAEGAEASGGAAAAAAGEGGPDAEKPSTGKKMVGFAGEAGDDGEGGATGSSGPGEGGLDAAGEGRRSVRVHAFPISKTSTMLGLFAKESAEIVTGISCWTVCSIGMMLFNKMAIKVFPVECTLVALQMAFTALVMVVFTWKTLHFGSVRDVLKWTIVIPFFSGLLLTSILALKGAPMTLVITLKSLTPIFSIFIERFYPNPIGVSMGMFMAIGVMIFGTVLYCLGMPRSHWGGVGWVFLNVFFNIVDRLLQRLMLAKDQYPVDMSKTAVTLLNNLEGMVPLIFVAWATREFDDIGPAFANLDAVGAVYVVLSCLVGLGISYTGVWAQSLISATSFLVLANANKFVIIFIEAFCMKAKMLKPVQIAGASVAIIGGVMYGKAKEALEARNSAKASDAAETTPLVDKKV